ncbi:hypothetical protein ASC82_18060 [Streptomyces sp. Root431]|uniref:hypothetical protein n=1 Tax=unclassified Streptomyces TaxID=2593676 RepID=UPI0006F87098|nr:hypothetical protein [Streptomyces sp. Root431]KQX11758.1 hypothetical protein ASC82_18060 [Streptomyces sp. Root431]
MRTNRLLLTAAAAGLALALTGCGGDGDETGKIPTAVESTASGGTGKTTGSGGSGSGKDEVTAYVDAQRAWVKCLRANGIDAPDPDENGQVDLGDARPLKTDPTSRRALEKCSADKAAVPAEIERRLAPKLTPEQIKKQFEFADCMQKNGAPDFPDPEADGHAYGDDQQWNATTAAAKQAARTCAPIIGDPVEHGPGKG